MASTRNKNTIENYKLEKRQYERNQNYNLSFGGIINEKLAGNGILPGKLSITLDGIDAESSLRGIGSTNLEFSREQYIPKRIIKEEVSLYDKKPVYIPRPLIIDKNQRPLL